MWNLFFKNLRLIFMKHNFEIFKIYSAADIIYWKQIEWVYFLGSNIYDAMWFTTEAGLTFGHEACYSARKDTLLLGPWFTERYFVAASCRLILTNSTIVTAWNFVSNYCFARTKLPYIVSVFNKLFLCYCFHGSIVACLIYITIQLHIEHSTWHVLTQLWFK